MIWNIVTTQTVMLGLNSLWQITCWNFYISWGFQRWDLCIRIASSVMAFTKPDDGATMMWLMSLSVNDNFIEVLEGE